MSSSPTRPLKDPRDNPRRLRKSRPTPAHALSTISPDEQDSDCYIVDHKSQESRAPRLHLRASIQVERVSSSDVLPAVHLPELFQPSNLDKIHDMHDPSAANVTLTNHSYLELYPSSQHSSHSVPASISSVGSSSLRGRNRSNPHPKPLPSHDDIIELDDDEEEAVHRGDVIEISSDSDSDEEMDVDNMLTLNTQKERVLTFTESKPSSSHSTSPPSSLDMEDSLFTPVPSSKRRRRVILDHVSVPPFPKGLNVTDYHSSSNMSSIAPRQGVEFRSVGDALAAAFVQNNRSPSPSLDKKGKGRERERERETTPPTPVRPKRRKRLPPHFGEGISTVPTTILNVHYPLIELEIPDFPPYLNDTWHRNTHWIERVRFKRHHTELHQGLPEMIAQMKSLGSSGNEQDDGPILPRVFAPLFERRADIAASLAAQWEYASPKHSRRGKSTNASETQNISSSSNSSFPTLLSDDISALHFAVLEEGQPLDSSTEMDQYLNDLGDSPAKSYRAGHPRSELNAYCGISYLTGFLHNTTQLPPDVASGVRDDAADSFLGVPPSPKDEHNLPSPLQYTYPFDHSHTLDDSFEHVFPEEGTWSVLPDVEQGAVSPKAVSPPESADTIDPSLLGGNEPPPKPPPPPIIPPNSTLIPKKRAPGPIIYVRRPPGVSASQKAPAEGTVTGKLGRNVQIRYRTSGSASPIDEGNVAPKKDAAGGTDEAVTGPSAIPGARPSLKIGIRRPGTSSTSDGSFVPSTSASPVVTSTPLSETKHPKVQEPTPAPRTLQKEPGPEAFETSFCHHCRRTTAKPKMQCSKRRKDRQICGKLFCDRCIIHRYPDLTFDRPSKTFVCPVCTDTCNCSTCARKRGEEYISMRGGGFAGLRAKSGIVLLPDESPSGQARNVRATPEPPTSAPQTMFWAHVYGLKGERVGRAFIGDASTSISAPPTQPVKGGKPKPTQKPKPKPKPKPIAKLKTKKPRVFIGLPLSEWKVRTFRDLEPSAPIPPLIAEDETYVGKGKCKAVERSRVYIGDAKWLYVPCARMPVSPQSSRASSPEPGDDWDSDGSLTPLEDLEEAMDWPQPDVGEAVTVTWPVESVCEQSVSARLSPDDVEKAIGIALAMTL